MWTLPLNRRDLITNGCWTHGAPVPVSLGCWGMFNLVERKPAVSHGYFVQIYQGQGLAGTSIQNCKAFLFSDVDLPSLTAVCGSGRDWLLCPRLLSLVHLSVWRGKTSNCQSQVFYKSPHLKCFCLREHLYNFGVTQWPLSVHCSPWTSAGSEVLSEPQRPVSGWGLLSHIRFTVISSSPIR